MSNKALDTEGRAPAVEAAPESACADNACSADPLALLGALTLGIGIGSGAGPALQPLVIWLVVGGCLVHGWGMVRGRLSGLSRNRSGGLWLTLINVASWIVIAGLAVAVTIAAGRTT